MKICTKCNTEKPRSEFYKGPNKDGLRSWCKPCFKANTSENRDPEKQRKYSRDWKRRNPQSGRKWREENPEKSKECTRRWQKNNAGAKKAAKARYRASKLQRTPTWSDSEKIRAVYDSCPEGWHVDHIYPLQGETVSGLHVVENLQLLPAKENLSKGNRIR